MIELALLTGSTHSVVEYMLTIQYISYCPKYYIRKPPILGHTLHLIFRVVSSPDHAHREERGFEQMLGCVE